jgi:hypothetical protein
MSSPRHDSEPVTVEVEVTEIDGVTVETVGPVPESESSAKPNGWTGWQGRVRTLDSRWWPLWVLLGIIGVVLALTVGLVLAAIYLVFRVVFLSIRWIAAFLTGSSQSGAITRR